MLAFPLQGRLDPSPDRVTGLILHGSRESSLRRSLRLGRYHLSQIMPHILDLICTLTIWFLDLNRFFQEKRRGSVLYISGPLQILKLFTDLSQHFISASKTLRNMENEFQMGGVKKSWFKKMERNVGTPKFLTTHISHRDILRWRNRHR